MISSVLTVIAICIGSSFGALARWQLGVALNTDGEWLPLGTLAANLIGGFLIGLLVSLFDSQPDLDPVWRLASVTGFLGALTTFSSFSLETVKLMIKERFDYAFALIGLHLVGSLLLTFIGIKIGQAAVA